MNNLSDFANFVELQSFWRVGEAPNRSLCPGRQKPSLCLCAYFVKDDDGKIVIEEDKLMEVWRAHYDE